jgi:apolipoprotein N-acyltransferase
MWSSALSKDLALAFLSGLLLVLSFPKFDLGFLAWVGLVPLLFAMEGKGLKGAFSLCYVAGLVFFAGIFYWIWLVPAYNVVDGILLAVGLPQYFTLWGVGLTWIRKRTHLPPFLVAPPLWVALEYIRSHLGFASLPWMLLGHSQYLYPPLIQITSFTGVYGLTFLVVLVNAAVAEALVYVRQQLSRRRAAWAFARSRLISLAVAGFLLAATALHGLFALSGEMTGDRITLALVQGNIPQGAKWDRSHRQRILDRYADLTKGAAQHQPLVIVWPETAVPGDVQHQPELRRLVSQVANDTKIHLLVGSAEYAKFTERQAQGKFYNSMYLFSPEGTIAGQYRKIVLLPFGEYEPSRGVIPWPAAVIAPSAMGSFLPGDQYTLFTVDGVTFAAVICWETIFPDLIREFVKQGARLIVNGTNEAWFFDTAAPYQLLAMSTFRAVENRVPVARAANTGVTALIDPFGRITQRLKGPDEKELFVEGFLAGTVLVPRGQTFYTRYGDVFAFLLIALCVALLSYSWLPEGIRHA